MRIRISHQTRYLYDSPARSVLQLLRVTPRDCGSQHVVAWRVEPSTEGHLRPFEDAFGNRCHQFSPDHPVDDLTLAGRVGREGHLVVPHEPGLGGGATGDLSRPQHTVPDIESYNTRSHRRPPLLFMTAPPLSGMRG